MVLKHEKKRVLDTIPQFCLRIPPKKAEQFERVRGMVDDIHDLYRKRQKDDEKTITKSEIIIEALEIGLKVLKKDIKG